MSAATAQITMRYHTGNRTNTYKILLHPIYDLFFLFFLLFFFLLAAWLLLVL